MIRACLIVLALLATTIMAQGTYAHGEAHQDYDDHVVEADGVRATHAWTNATTGSTALVYVELENISESAVTLTGAETELAASAQLVGLENTGGELVYTVIPQMPVAAGSKMVLSPNGLAIRLEGLTAPLVHGEHFHIEIALGDVHLDTAVEIESATATQHSHAGHQH